MMIPTETMKMTEQEAQDRLGAKNAEILKQQQKCLGWRESLAWDQARIDEIRLSGNLSDQGKAILLAVREHLDQYLVALGK